MKSPIKMAFFLVMGLFCSLLVASLSHGDELNKNWSQFRGPDGNGVAENATPPVEWSGTSSNLKWKTELMGKGSSSPIVWDDKIIVTTAVNTRKTADGKDIPETPRAESGQRRGRPY